MVLPSSKSYSAILCILFGTLLLIPSVGIGKGGGYGGGHSGGHSSSHSSHTSHTSTSADRSSRAVAGVQRDSHGRIARSAHAKNEFKKTHPCPSTGRSSGACPGYVIDHVKPLKRGGADRPANMQWQTREATREKDRTE